MLAVLLQYRCCSGVAMYVKTHDFMKTTLFNYAAEDVLIVMSDTSPPEHFNLATIGIPIVGEQSQFVAAVAVSVAANGSKVLTIIDDEAVINATIAAAGRFVVTLV